MTVSNYFNTTGIITANFPLATEVNSTGTTGTTTYASSYWKATDTVVLRAIICLGATPTGDAGVSLVDRAGTAVFTFACPANAAWPRPQIPPDGIRMPTGGFGVTTIASNNWCFVFDIQRL